MMNNYVEVCGGCDGCTSEVSHACNCGDPVVFLCSGCIVQHLSKPVIHTFISLDQARGMLSDPSYASDFYVDICKYSVLKSSLETYIRKIESFKEKAMIAKQEIIDSIEKEFRAKLELLSDVQNKAQVKLEVVMKRMNKVTSLGDEMISSFEASGVKGVLPSYLESFEIRNDIIHESLNKLFVISGSIPEENKADNDILYFPKQNSKQLIKYNITTNRLETIELGSTIEKEFYYSSSCILPDGNIIIVGRYNPESGDTYRFNTQTNQVTKLKPLNTSRSFLGLTCNGEYLYAFGGYISSAYSKSKKAERMKWLGNGWEELQDMKEARYYFGIFHMNTKIYLAGGYGITSVEYYDTINNKFHLIANFRIQEDLSYSGAFIDDTIYIIGRYKIQIFNKYFTFIEVKPKSGNYKSETLNSPIIKDKKFYYHCFDSGFIQMLDADSKTVSQI